MGVMCYLALDKKSNFHTRLASLAALAVMVLTVIICLIIVFSDNTVPVDYSTLVVGAPVEVKDDNENIFLLLFTILFFLALFVVIAVLAMKEHKKSAPKKGEVIFSVY